MSIYVNDSDRRVYLDVPIEPIPDSIEIEVRDQGHLVHTVNTVVFEDNRYFFKLPFSMVHSDITYSVNWRFNYLEEGQTYEYNRIDEVEIVTPILPLRDIESIVGEGFTSEELAGIERSVRYIIQAHTGQFFGQFVGHKFVSGSGEPYLRLPARLIELDSVNGNKFWNGGLALRGSGWYLQSRTYGIPTIRADYYGWHERPYSGRVPIVAPNSQTLFNFVEHTEYKIDGTWGWNRVPAAVQEAARLLVNDYACGDSSYRDRFLSSMQAADWRIQFHDGAFSNTGNVRANQLLAEYVLRRGWSVI